MSDTLSGYGLALKEEQAPPKLPDGKKSNANVHHPAHYCIGGIETYDFIRAKQLSYELSNVVKYVSRAYYKGNVIEDLEKAQYYLNLELTRIREAIEQGKPWRPYAAK